MVVGSYNNPLGNYCPAVALGNCDNSLGDYPVVVVGNCGNSLGSCYPAVAIGNCDNSLGDASFDSHQVDDPRRGMGAANESHFPDYDGNHHYIVDLDQNDPLQGQLVFAICVVGRGLLFEVDNPDQSQDSPLSSWQPV